MWTLFTLAVALTSPGETVDPEGEPSSKEPTTEASRPLAAPPWRHLLPLEALWEPLRGSQVIAAEPRMRRSAVEADPAMMCQLADMLGRSAPAACSLAP